MEIIKNKIESFKKTALDAVFPEFCVVCKIEGELFCSECRVGARVGAQARECPFCERVTGTGSVCRRCARVSSLDGCVALAQYAEPAVKGLIKQWKYQSNHRAEVYLHGWLGRTNILHLLPAQPWAVVPVRLHAARERWRGFDQSVELAKMISYEYDLPLNPCLYRAKPTVPQASLGQRRRQPGEMNNKFKVFGEVPECALICDDVLTTGTTLEAAAHALKEAGTQVVWGITIAKGQ